jgi:hypothetical protein
VLAHLCGVLIVERPKRGRFRVRQRQVQRDELLLLGTQIAATPVAVSLCARAVVYVAEIRIRAKNETINLVITGSPFAASLTFSTGEYIG